MGLLGAPVVHQRLDVFCARLGDFRSKRRTVKRVQALHVALGPCDPCLRSFLTILPELSVTRTTLAPVVPDVVDPITPKRPVLWATAWRDTTHPRGRVGPTVRARHPEFAQRGYGRIVNIGSLAGQNGGTATGAHYAASKGGIATLTKVFARDLGPHGVTVNSVLPGAAGRSPGIRLLPSSA
ncbi:SDR family NAD(P)-dependent oxidoreductase [Streptomyces sp. NPDC093589]|uniref:SDR family NAD(P)-dependent oxidoreductase n=1 Tax=Streptomyces sp. NPDC093589 TaxID=3366043 RepID=UPI0038140EFD